MCVHNLYVWSLLLLLCLPFSSCKKVLLISMDGFRHDYLDMARSRNIPLPAMESMMRSGVRGLRVMNAFVSMTLPNHHTLITGLYPESHGIVHNAFYDPRFPNKLFDMGDQASLNEDYWFADMPEPIWATLERQSGRHSASMLWPVTDAAFLNKWRPFKQVGQYATKNSKGSLYPYKNRIDEAVEWLRNPEWNIDLVLLYFDEPDAAGHHFGPSSMEVMQVVQDLDTHLNYLLQRLKDFGLLETVDIILTADHGMTEVHPNEQTIHLNDYVPPELYQWSSVNPVGMIYPNNPTENNTKFIFEKLQNAHPRLKAFLKGSVPEELHYNDNPRIPSIILLADNGWSVNQKREDGVAHANGHHGYDPTTSPDMLPFFLAMGPSFRKNYVTSELHMVDIYPLMCHLLKIPAQPNNGSLDRIAHITIEGARDFSTTFPSSGFSFKVARILVATFITFLACSLTIFLLVWFCKHRNVRKFNHPQYKYRDLNNVKDP